MAGYGGDKWGASGGGIDNVGAPEPLLQALSYGQRQTNYETQVPPPNTIDVLSEMSRGTRLAGSFNGSIVEGHSTVGNPTVGLPTNPPVGPNCTLLGSTAVAAFAMPGCMIPGVMFT